MDFVQALETAQGVFDQYKADQLKWWRKMDGTPILNDVAVRMAEAFRDAAAPAPVSGVPTEWRIDNKLSNGDVFSVYLKEQPTEAMLIEGATVTPLGPVVPVSGAVVAPTLTSYLKSQRKMIERAIVGLRDGWATRKDADDALAILGSGFAPLPAEQAGELPPLQVIPLDDCKELRREDRGHGVHGWLLYSDGKLVRGINIFEAGFIDSAIRAALAARQAPDGRDAARFVFEHTNTKCMLDIELQALAGNAVRPIDWWRERIDAAIAQEKAQ